jgi:hypothetical protein
MNSVVNMSEFDPKDDAITLVDILELRNATPFLNVADDDCITLVDSLKSRRGSETSDKSSNRDCSLTLARLAFKDLLAGSSDSVLDFISKPDADFASLAVAAAKEAAKTELGFTLVLDRRGLENIPEHWIRLVADQLRR